MASFMAIFLFCRCQRNEMSRRNLTRVIVERNTASLSDSIPEKIEKKKTAAAVRPVAGKSAAVTKGNYHVIIVSFMEADRQEAEKYLQSLKKEYPGARTVESKGRIRISCSSHMTLKEAAAARDTLVKERPAYKDAWVLKYSR